MGERVADLAVVIGVEQLSGFGVVPGAGIVDCHGKATEVADDQEGPVASGGGRGGYVDPAVAAGVFDVPVDIAPAAEVMVESLYEFVELVLT
jgi:hypothetical protein